MNMVTRVKGVDERKLQEMVERVRAACTARPDIQLAYLFGSCIHGTPGALSDVDIAILLDGEADLDDRLDLIYQLGKTLGVSNVDLVLLNEAPPLLGYEVIAHGQLVYARTDDILNSFEGRTYLRYFDTNYLRATTYEYLKNWLREKEVSPSDLTT